MYRLWNCPDFGIFGWIILFLSYKVSYLVWVVIFVVSSVSTCYACSPQEFLTCLFVKFTVLSERPYIYPKKSIQSYITFLEFCSLLYCNWSLIFQLSSKCLCTFPSIFEFMCICFQMLIVVYEGNRYIKFHWNMLVVQSMFWLFVMLHVPIVRLDWYLMLSVGFTRTIRLTVHLF